MSTTCPDCGAVASYGNELAHKSDCPSIRKPFDFKTLRRLTPEEEEKIRQQPKRPRTPEEETAFRRMLTMPVDDEQIDEVDKVLEAARPLVECPTCMRRFKLGEHCDLPTCSLMPADAQGTVESAREYVDRAIASYAGDPADNQFQKGFLAALEVVRDEAFTAPVKDDLPLTEVVAKLRAIVAANGGLNYEVEHNQCSAGTGDVDRVARAICLAEFGDETKQGDARCCQVGGKDGCCLDAVRPVAQAAIAAMPTEPQEVRK